MDPVTQGLIGASATGACASKHRLKSAIFVGALAGMAPDLDTFIRSSEDHLLWLEYHRHFTHSLLFIPVGALAVSGILYPLMKRYLSFILVFLFCLLGYATHGLLDSCTSYGTLLLWPFSKTRVAWDTISIIDPIYSGILFISLILATLYKKPKIILIALLISFSYMGFGFYQNAQARKIQAILQNQRQHTKVRQSTVKPSIFNVILWKSIYQHEGLYYADAIWTVPFLGHRIYEGDTAIAFDYALHANNLASDSILAKDIRRFAWFSSNYLSIDPDHPGFLGDARYSLLPHQVSPLWGIRVDYTQPGSRAVYQSNRVIDPERKQKFFRMLKGLEIN